MYYSCSIPLIIILFSQSPAGKRAKKANTKTMSPLPNQAAAADADKEASPHNIIPHIVLTLTETDNATEQLEALPPVDKVWFLLQIYRCKIFLKFMIISSSVSVSPLVSVGVG